MTRSFLQKCSSMLRLIKGKLLIALTNVDRRPLLKSQIKKIIVLRYDRIGDLIVSLPLINALKEIFPLSETVVIASKVNAPVAALTTSIDKIVVKETNVFFWVLQLFKLRTENPDLVIDLNHSVAPHTILATRILNAPHSATPYKDGRWGVKGSNLRLFDIMPEQHPLKYARPIAETYLDIARALDYKPQNNYPYPLKKFEKPSQIREKFIVLNGCGSRSEMRLRNVDLLAIADVVKLLCPTYKVVVPAVEDNFYHFKSLFNSRNNVVVATPHPTIIPTLALVQHAQLVITPDTALVHIACAYSVRLIAVYTSDDSQFAQWKPLNSAETCIIRSDNPKSLSGYSSEKLLDALKSLLTA